MAFLLALTELTRLVMAQEMLRKGDFTLDAFFAVNEAIERFADEMGLCQDASPALKASTLSGRFAAAANLPRFR